MTKNMISIFGVLVILFMGLGMVSANMVFYPSGLAGSVEQGHVYNATFKIYNNNTNDFTGVSYNTANLKSGSHILSMEQVVKNLPTTIENKTNTSEIDYSISIPSNQAIGTYNGNLTIKGVLAGNNTSFILPIGLEVVSPTPTPSEYDFCENGTVGNLKITDVSFSNMGEGEDENWYLLDNVEIDAEIRNTNNSEDLRNVMVEIMVVDGQGNDVTNDFNFDRDKINLHTISSDDYETAIFKIPEVPADLKSGTYKVYIKAYSEDDENNQCVAQSSELDQKYYQKIKVTREDDPSVIVKQGSPKISASCGDKNVELPLYIYNLGSNKEKEVLVTLNSHQLGINKTILIDNLMSGKKKEITFFFDVPSQLQKSLYSLDIKTYYDYDDSNGNNKMDIMSYNENSYDDLGKTFSTLLNILSCKSPAPTISASLESKAVIGTNLVIKALITNNGNDNNFVISASNYEPWAEVVGISPQTVSIGKGESKEVTITLSPKTTGEHSFNINTIVDGQTYPQAVSVNVAAKPGLFDLENIDNNTFYIVAGIAILLILIVMVIIIRPRK